MDLIKILKQFKNVEPNGDFVKKSRLLILGEEKARPLGFFNVILRSVEAGATLALAGILVFVILGGISQNGLLEPPQITAINPAGIKAEAEAIDIQIRLTDVDYEEAKAAVSGESTIPFQKTEVDKTDGESIIIGETKTISVEEALELLAE